MFDADGSAPMARKPGVSRPIVATVQALVREIEADPTRVISLSGLARRAGYSASYLQRQFTAITGSSPKAFQTAARMRLLKRGLRSQGSVLAAMTAAGFSSTSRLYERADAELGMTPTEYRRGGAGLEIAWATVATPLGKVLIGATARGICALAFGGSDAALARGLRAEFPAATLTPMPAASRAEFGRWMAALNGYLAGRLERLNLPLDVQGTAFQLLVWRYLRSVPRGVTRSYAEVAKGIGRPEAARAVARACAANRIAVLIPCHRVLRGGGEISGYRWGVARKRALLKAEGARISRSRSTAGG